MNSTLLLISANPVMLNVKQKENPFDALPKEMMIHVFKFMSSKNRAELCSVSKYFEYYAIITSGIIFNHEELYAKHDLDDIPLLMEKYHISDIIISGDYHLLARLKYKPDDIELACQSGCIDIVNQIMKNREIVEPLDYDAGLIGACRGGNFDIVKLMVISDAKNYGAGLFNACVGGYQAIVEYMITLGANDLNGGLMLSCQYGHLNLAKYLISRGAVNINLAFTGACVGNHHVVIDYLISKGANDWAQGILATSDYSIFEFLITKDTHASDVALKLACKKGLIYTVRFFNQSSYDLRDGLRYAKAYGEEEVCEYIIEELTKKDITPYEF